MPHANSSKAAAYYSPARSNFRSTFLFLAVVCATFAGAVANAYAAAPDRVTRPVDGSHTRAVPGTVHRLATPQSDQGPVDPAMPMEYMLMMTTPSAAQQADLDRLLADQQNPSSPQFHKWLTPEEFGNRFGLSASDHSKIAAWLRREGFKIDEMARGRNWVAFSGTAGQVSKSFHTSIHRFQVNGEKHYANTSEPEVPEALAGVVAGFIGFNDFRLKSMAIPVPLYTTGATHYLAPEDYGAIYNIAPLYQAGLDGAGVGIAVVGQSDVLLSDLAAFKTRYNLPANAPKMILYGGSDPGYNGAEIEGILDLEWSSALAPKANITYVYGASAFSAMISAVNGNYAPIITISYASCEANYAGSAYRSVAQQGNAQGITLLAAAGDAGASCDPQGNAPFASEGQSVLFPGVMPEVTAVGGTQFVEGTGTYWSTTNSANFGSALSYIPEAAWNESSTSGLGSGGGGASRLFTQPAWQTGSGVPNDGARHVPDVALSAAGHDAYYIYFLGINGGVAGTSAATPSMAGIVALLNQYLVTNGALSRPGLGNINPQLYRLAQSNPSIFHDVVSGSNIVPCAQGSPDCLTGSFGYNAGPAYDMATGLGSVDANALAANWNSSTNGSTVTLTSSTAKTTTNDTIQLTATVASAGGAGTPTGTVAFSIGTLALGSATLGPDGTASVTFPAYLVGTGTYSSYAEYSGDTAFSGGGASTKIQITAPTGAASIVPSVPFVVWASGPDSQGLLWQTSMTLREVAGVAAMLTGFTIDGQAQTVSKYFSTPNILPSGSLSTTFVMRNQATPLVHTYGFTGVDADGQTWSRQVSFPYYTPPNISANLTATPLTVVQNTAADPSCQWPVQLHLDDLGGGPLNTISSLSVGPDTLSSQIVPIFGTSRLDAFGSISGTLCFAGIAPPTTETIRVALGNGFSQQLTVFFGGPPANPATISAAPANLTLAGDGSQASVAVGLSDPTQPWTASVFPANRTTSWLSLSQLSGTGSGQISLAASGAGFEPGVYRATIVLQSTNAVPQSVNVPVMFVLGGSTTGTAIAGIADPVSGNATGAPGMQMMVTGTKLANATQTAPATSPIPYPLAGVSAYVNGLAAPIVSVSPTQLVFQIPYAAGAGPAVLGINNNGQVAGFQFQIANAAPGILVDAKGNLLPAATAKQGATATLMVTGAGEVTPALKTAYFYAAATPLASRDAPVLPVSVTVGGVPAFLQAIGLASGVLGETQVNVTVPAVPGVQPVVVTVGGIASAPVNLTVQ